MPGPEAATVVGSGRPSRASKVDLRSISLEQTLADFETANARVMDLTQRLLDAVDERRHLRTELELLQIEHARLKAEATGAHAAVAALQQELAAERSSNGYLVARVLRGLRRQIGL
jgi:predicted  nucleic acid-binding Zn-ribbon protein